MAVSGFVRVGRVDHDVTYTEMQHIVSDFRPFVYFAKFPAILVCWWRIDLTSAC